MKTIVVAVLLTTPVNVNGWIGKTPATLRDCPPEANISISYNSGIYYGWKRHCGRAEKSFVPHGDRRESPSNKGGQKGYGGKR